MQDTLGELRGGALSASAFGPIIATRRLRTATKYYDRARGIGASRAQAHVLAGMRDRLEEACKDLLITRPSRTMVRFERRWETSKLTNPQKAFQLCVPRSLPRCCPISPKRWRL